MPEEITERVLSVTTAQGAPVLKAFVDVIFVDPETCIPHVVLVPVIVSLLIVALAERLYVPVPPVPVPNDDTDGG